MIWIFICLGVALISFFIWGYLSSSVKYKNTSIKNIRYYIHNMDIQCEPDSFVNIEINEKNREIIQIQKSVNEFYIIFSEITWPANKLQAIRDMLSDDKGFEQKTCKEGANLFLPASTPELATEKVVEVIERIYGVADRSRIFRIYTDGELKNGLTAKSISVEMERRKVVFYDE